MQKEQHNTVTQYHQRIRPILNGIITLKKVDEILTALTK